MPFEKVATQVDFPAQERAVLAFWEQIQPLEKLQAKNRGKKPWSFLDGPITANNPMGVHHAWGRTYKDAYQRFFAMTGHELRYQNGFDCQGLWVEVEVEKELKLQSKRDIENLVPGDRFQSIDRFVSLCKERVDKFAKKQTEQSIRLGYWMDWDREEDWQKPAGQRRSYFTMSEENNYTIWSFLKKCFERGLVYRGYDAMPWCPRCGVGLSQMEMHEGYQLVAHRSVFVKFPLRGRAGEALLVWTTTPWTLTSNVAAAVNPALTYLQVKHRDESYYLAKGAFTAKRLEEQFKRKEWVEGVPKLKSLEQQFKEKGGFEIVRELPGSELVGWQYDGPFDDLPAQQHPFGYPSETASVVRKQQWGPDKSAQEIHRVVAWAEVGETEGTGIVHIAPGCGKEDFHLGKAEKLVPIAPLDESGLFLPGFGDLSGKSALEPSTTDWLLDQLQKRQRLFAVEKYPHSYPHCWRCKTEVLFRLVDEWFISMSWREEIMEVTKQVKFLPDSINGQARELDWLKNMGDWMISKKRYWGLALPIWVDEVTGEFEVIGSYEELKSRAVEGLEHLQGRTPHRPWIDLVKLRNPKTGNLMSRIPDVGNPWLDAGIVPFSTVSFNTDRAYWEKWYPADLITECFPGQFRNWFYALLAMSTMMVNRPPFRVLLGHGLVRDENGEEMHKTAGNSIPFEGAADVGYEIKDKKTQKLKQCTPMSADVMRWLYCRQNPASNINFGPGSADELRNRFVLKLWFTYHFFCDNARQEKGGYEHAGPSIPAPNRPDMDRWLLSDLQLLIRLARTEFPRFNIQGFCLAAEEFVNEKLSNWYVRRSKERFYGEETTPDQQAAFQTLHQVLLTLTKLFAPIMPFMTETMYRNLGGPESGPISVHLCDFPEEDPSLIDAKLSQDMDALLKLKTLGSAVRNAVKLKTRQPLAELRIQPADAADQAAGERFKELLCDELNVKKVTLHDANLGPLLRAELKPNLKTWGEKFGAQLQAVQASLLAANHADLAEKAQRGQSFTLSTPAGSVQLEPSDVFVHWHAPEGWAGLAERGTQVLLDARVSDELKLEGLARDIVRQIQELRKKSGFDIEDRLELYLESASPLLKQAYNTHRETIMADTLTRTWATQPMSGQVHRTDVSIEGQPLKIEVQKVS